MEEWAWSFNVEGFGLAGEGDFDDPLCGGWCGVVPKECGRGDFRGEDGGFVGIVDGDFCGCAVGVDGMGLEDGGGKTDECCAGNGCQRLLELACLHCLPWPEPDGWVAGWAKYGTAGRLGW